MDTSLVLTARRGECEGEATHKPTHGRCVDWLACGASKWFAPSLHDVCLLPACACVPRPYNMKPSSLTPELKLQLPSTPQHHANLQQNGCVRVARCAAGQEEVHSSGYVILSLTGTRSGSRAAIENNPEVMSSLVHKLGLSPKLAFHDVFSIDEPELLAFVPRPAHALLLVFPVSETYEKFRVQEDKDRPEYSGCGPEEEVVWYKQTIGNACGLIGLLHGVSNGAARSNIGTVPRAG